MKTRRGRRGLTLMEVLVAITLLGLLSAGSLTALRVAAGSWQRATSRLMLNRRVATANGIFHAAIEGALPVYAEHDRRLFLFFQGHPQSMRFVTPYSLERGPRGGLRIVELQVTTGERGRMVLLNERFYDGPAGAGRLVTGVARDQATGQFRMSFVPIEALPSSFVIADELAGCTFSYLMPEGPGQPARWVSEWPRLDRLPEAVSIQMAPRPDPARLLPVTVTVPIRSTLGVL